MKICTSHHHACDCREQRVAVLNKAALDAAFELRSISNIIGCVSHEEKAKADGLADRIYNASEALCGYTDLTTEEETHL